MVKYEYCVMCNGNNVECFNNINEAISFANQHRETYILLVNYDNNNEISCERIWEYENKKHCE